MFYIDIYPYYDSLDNQEYDDYDDYDDSLPEYHEYLEFYLFFINHEIPFNINTNTYIFNFNQGLKTTKYSQDYFQFKIPLFQNDKMLKIKIKLRNENFGENDLFTITNTFSSEEISYNTELFSNKLDT